MTIPAEKLMDGKAVSKKMLDRTAERVAIVKHNTGITPCLATVLVGDDPASATYVKMKRKRCEAVGMESLRVEMSAETTTEQLVARIKELSDDKKINGILLQHPVPDQIDERAAFEAIAPGKDVDGVTIYSFGAAAFDLPGFGSCTPAGMVRLLDEYDVDVKGKHAVVIGRSPILGKPLSMMLLARHATVTICHSRTQDLSAIVRQADVICACVGRANFVKGDWVKNGAVVLDAGYNEGNMGDVDFNEVAPKASLITPVPGGVGPMTIATLIEQTCYAAAEQHGLADVKEWVKEDGRG